MKRSVLLTPLCLVVLASGASGANVSVRANLNETFDFGDNLFLSPDPLGSAARFFTSVNLLTSVVTPDTDYLLNSNFSYFQYYGSGAEDQNPRWGTPLSQSFLVNHSTASTKYNFSASWNRSDVASTSLRQTGFSSGRGTIDNYNATGGLSYNLSRLDSLSWSVNASTVSYSDPGESPYLDFSTTLGWTHRVSQTTTFTTSIYADMFFSDDPGNTQRVTWQPTASLTSQLTKRLSWYGSVGLILIDATQNDSQPDFASSIFARTNSAPFLSTGSQQQIGRATGWSANTVLTYTPRNDTSITFTAAHTTSPTLFGELVQIESVGARIGYRINQYSDFAFFTQASQTQEGAPGTTTSSSSPETQFFTVSADYSYRLSRDWRAGINYAYRQRHDIDGTVSSNTILLSLTGGFNLFGQPPTLVKTPAELIGEDILRSQQVFPFIAPY